MRGVKGLKTFCGVIGFGGFGLNHDGGIATLIVLRFVGDGSDDVTGRQSEGSSEGGECRDEYGDNDFDDLCFVHNV